MSYQVGQILFFIPKSKTMLIPIQVVEEISKKTLVADNSTTYMVKVGRDAEHVNLNQLDGELFLSPEAAQRSLLARSTTAIQKVVEKAKALATAWYGVAQKQPVEVVSSAIERTIADTTSEFEGETLVELEDGTKARIKMPSAT